MALIRGENVMLYSYQGGFWKPFVCGRSCTFHTNAETLETSGKGSGIYRTNVGVAVNWDATFEGLVYLQKINTIALPDARALQVSLTTILFRYQRIDEAGNTYLDEGTAIITDISDDGNQDNAAGFSMQLKGTGPLTQIFTPTVINPTGKVKIYEYTGIAGEYSFTTPLLNLVDVINVFIDGQARSRIILSGTPLGQEAKYTSAAGLGRIESAQPIDVGVEVRVEYQDI